MSVEVEPVTAPTPDDERAPRDTLRRALALTGVRARDIAASVGLGTLALGCATALAAVSAWMIARASQMPLEGALSVAAVAVRTFGIGRGVMRYTERLASHDTALRGMTTLRTRVYQSLAAGSSEAVLRLRRGDLLARVGADVDAVGDLVVRAVVPVGVAVTLGVGTCVAMGLLWPPAGIGLAACLLVAGWLAPAMTAASVRHAEQRASAARARMTAVALGTLDDTGPLTVAGRTSEQAAQLADADAEIARAVDRSAGPAALAVGLGLAAQGTAVLIALVTGIPAVRSGQLAPTALAVVVLTPLAAFEACTALPMAAVQLQRSRAAGARILAMLDAAAPPPDAAATTPTASIDAVPTGSTSGDRAPGGPTSPGSTAAVSAQPGHSTSSAPRLTATGLSVGWTGRPPVLTGVDVALTVGRSVAVAGPSGAGKTTLLLTLAGLLPARAGHVGLDGADLASLPRTDVVRAVVATTEDAHVFGTTVLENLRVGRGDVTADQAREALSRVGLTDWLDALPDGLDTLLGPDARTVSGGERRRLLLARALLCDAPLLLLDEPAEHLDPTAADRLVGDLLAPGPDRGVLLVTHRVSALAAADEVLWVQGGRIAARGRHDRLLDEVPGYAAAWQREHPRGGEDG